MLTTYQFLEIKGSCPKTNFDGIWWDRTTRGQTDTKQCPFNAVGSVTRYCHPLTSWDHPKFFCTSQLFAAIQSMVMNAIYKNNISIDMGGATN